MKRKQPKMALRFPVLHRQPISQYDAKCGEMGPSVVRCLNETEQFSVVLEAVMEGLRLPEPANYEAFLVCGLVEGITRNAEAHGVSPVTFLFDTIATQGPEATALLNMHIVHAVRHSAEHRHRVAEEVRSSADEARRRCMSR